MLVPGLPQPSVQSRAVSPELEQPPQNTRYGYKINADGTDAILKFGKYRGRTVSWLAENKPDYLFWMMNGGKGRADPMPFSRDLLDVIRYRMMGKVKM